MLRSTVNARSALARAATPRAIGAAHCAAPAVAAAAPLSTHTLVQQAALAGGASSVFATASPLLATNGACVAPLSSSAALAAAAADGGDVFKADGTTSAALAAKMNTVYTFLVKEKLFLAEAARAEVQWFFRELNLDTAYYREFDERTIASHVALLASSKELAKATNNVRDARRASRASVRAFCFRLPSTVCVQLNVLCVAVFLRCFFCFFVFVFVFFFFFVRMLHAQPDRMKFESDMDNGDSIHVSCCAVGNGGVVCVCVRNVFGLACVRAIVTRFATQFCTEYEDLLDRLEHALEKRFFDTNNVFSLSMFRSKGLVKLYSSVETFVVSQRSSLSCCVWGCILEQAVGVEPPAAALERGLDGFERTRALGMAEAEAVGHHVEQLARAARRGQLALGLHAREAAHRQPLRHLFGRGASRKLDRKGDRQARIVGRAAAMQVGVDRLRRVVAHRQRAGPVE